MATRTVAALGLAIGLVLIWHAARSSNLSGISQEEMAAMKSILRTTLEKEDRDSRTRMLSAAGDIGTKDSLQDRVAPAGVTGEPVPEAEAPGQEPSRKMPSHAEQWLNWHRTQPEDLAEQRPEPEAFRDEEAPPEPSVPEQQWPDSPGPQLAPEPMLPGQDPQPFTGPAGHLPGQAPGGQELDRNPGPYPGAPSGGLPGNGPHSIPEPPGGLEKPLLPPSGQGAGSSDYFPPDQEGLHAPPPSVRPRRDGPVDPRFRPEQPGPRRFAPTPDFDGGGSPFGLDRFEPGDRPHQERRR